LTWFFRPHYGLWVDSTSNRNEYQECSAFSFGYLPGVWVLKAEFSEHSIGSIFIGRLMKYDRGWGLWDIYTEPGSGKPERANRKVSNRLGVGGIQLVGEGCGI